MSKSPDGYKAEGSSKTLNRVTKDLKKFARVEMKLVGRPKARYEIMRDDILPAQLREWKLHYYERGLRRGFIEACDALRDGRLRVQDGEIRISGKTIVIRRKFRFQDGTRKRRRFEFERKDLE